MQRANGRIRLKRIGEWRKVFIVPSWIALVVAIPSAVRPPQVDRESADVLREHRPAFVKKDEQVGGAVVIAVDDRSNVLVSRRVELFNQIDPIIEIPIRFTSDELSVVVILLDVRATVEIRIDSYFGGLAFVVVVLPDIRSTVAVPVFCADVSPLRPH